jgi:hypothetical protein
MSPLTPPSPLPPIRSATLPAYSPATPPAAGQPDFAGKPPVPMGKKASPGSTSGQKAEMGRALFDPDGPSHYRGSPFEQCTLQIFPSDYTWLIQIKPNQIQTSEFQRGLIIFK